MKTVEEITREMYARSVNAVSRSEHGAQVNIKDSIELENWIKEQILAFHAQESEGLVKAVEAHLEKNDCICDGLVDLECWLHLELRAHRNKYKEGGR